LVATFSASAGAERLKLDAAAENYKVSWDTRASNLDPVPNYRATVLVVGRSLGYLDVDVVPTNKDLKGVDATQFVGLVAGRALVIKFRVEKGDFLVAGPGGGNASLSGGLVGISVPSGALGAPVTLFADPVADEPVAAIGLIPGTVFDITPSGTRFSKPVRLSIRYDEAACTGSSASTRRSPQREERNSVGRATCVTARVRSLPAARPISAPLESCCRRPVSPTSYVAGRGRRAECRDSDTSPTSSCWPRVITSGNKPRQRSRSSGGHSSPDGSA
jgi:hypothetical protein